MTRPRPHLLEPVSLVMGMFGVLMLGALLLLHRLGAFRP